MDIEGETGTQRLLSVAFENPGVLQAAYMPFIHNGGLFIPTTRSFVLGDEVFVLLRLADDAASIPVAGKVVWITPQQAQGGKEAGIGIQFNDHDDVARERIEATLAGLAPAGGQAGYTM